MEYADSVWVGGNAINLNCLDMVQKYAARVVTGAMARCSTALFMENVRWPSFQSRRKQHRSTLSYKTVNGLSPPYLTTLLPGRVGERTRYALRFSHNLTQPMCRTQIYSRSFIPNTVDDWNRLDINARNKRSITMFKSYIHTTFGIIPTWYYYGPRWETIHLARIRIKCSMLNSHL